MQKVLLQSILMLVLLSVVTGIIYPCLVTAIAQIAFPHQANGSLIKDDKDIVIGSELLGQQFSEAKYFSSRPSSTSPYQYNAAGSSGSNLGPTNEDLVKRMKERLQQLKAFPASSSEKVPIDLVTSSSSGLDPNISVEAADYQINRVAAARGLSKDKISNLVKECTEPKQLYILGEARVNVLKLNLLLDKPK